jgi:hypothetical protein
MLHWIIVTKVAEHPVTSAMGIHPMYVVNWWVHVNVIGFLGFVAIAISPIATYGRDFGVPNGPTGRLNGCYGRFPA